MTLRIIVISAALAVVAARTGQLIDPHASQPGVPPAMTEICRVESSGRASGSSADICEQISLRWTALFGTTAPSGVVELVSEDGYSSTTGAGRWTLNVPVSARTRKGTKTRTSDGILSYYSDNIVPHEAGHALLAVYAGSLAASVTSGQYATQAPDWFDEAVAVWMESAHQRAKRSNEIANAEPSLSRLVTLAHPGIETVHSNVLAVERKPSTRTVTAPCDKCVWLPDSLRRKYQIIDVGTNAVGQPDTVVWYADRSPMKDDVPEQKYFYPLSYALLRFIRMRGGAAAIRELMSRYRVDPRPRIEVLSALPGLPATLPAFEKEWHEFLAKMPPEKD